jgi:sulfate transport system permease protein
MGEFGAVYVVSGHIAGATDTMPLRVEKLFQEYRTPASMAVASVLAGLALVTLVAKFVIERRLEAEARELEAARSLPDTIDGPDSQPDAKSRTPTQGSFA